LELGAPIQVRVYAGEDVRQLAIEGQFNDNQVQRCWQRANAQGYMSASREGETLSIESRDASGCLSLGLGRPVVNEGSLLGVSLPYKSEGVAKPHFCVVNDSPDYRCLHEDVYERERPSNDWARVERLVELEKGREYWLDLVGRPGPVPGESAIIEYGVPDLAVYELINRVDISDGVWIDAQQTHSLRLAPGEHSIWATWKASPVEVNWATEGKQVGDNCDLFDRGKVSKKVIGSSAVELVAENGGSLCDQVVLADLSNQQSYIMRVVGEHTLGRGLKAILFNDASKHTDLEVLLGTGQFDQSYGVLDWPGLEDKGYIVSVESRSFWTRNFFNPVRYNGFLSGGVGLVGKDNDSTFRKARVWIYGGWKPNSKFYFAN
jgi:hypothetical protein